MRQRRADRRTMVATFAAVVGLFAPTAALAQGPALGGQNGQDAESTKASATGEGVAAPRVDWQTTLEGYRQFGGDEYEMVFDAAGHVLFQGVDVAGDPDVETLVAVDRATGEVDWTVGGVSAACGVVASDDGMIYGMTEVTGADEVLVIDAVDGQVVQSYDPQTAGQGMETCNDSLRLAGDGTLLAMSGFEFKQRLYAFDTDGGLSLAWTHDYFIEGVDGDTAATFRPVITADGDEIYHCRIVPEEERPDDADSLLMFEKLDLATGNLVDEVPIHENASCHIRGLIAVPGGAIVAAGGARAQSRMVRIDDAGGSISVGWSKVHSRNEDLDESGVGNYPAGHLSLSGDNIISRGAGGGTYSAFAVATGELVWQYHASGLNTGFGNASVDRYGNVYLSPLESFSGQGHPRFAVSHAELFGETAPSNAGMGFVTVGPDGGLFARGSVEGDDKAIYRIETAPSQRLAGTNRFATAADIATARFRRGIDTVFLAVGTGFADALTGGPLAAVNDAPILLTGTDTLPADTSDALDLLQPANVIALGGTGVISDQVLADAARAAGNAATDRYAGAGRYETAAVIADQLPASDTAYLAVGGTFPDSLAGGPATDGAPILLVGTDTLPDVTATALAELAPDTVIALGGDAAISDAVLAEAAQAAGGASTDRLAGADRFDTAVAIATTVVDDADFAGTVFVATGLDYPDAVTAASAAEAAGAPIVLTAPDLLPQSVSSWLDSLDDLRHVIILGGESAVSADVAAQLAALTQ